MNAMLSVLHTRVSSLRNVLRGWFGAQLLSGLTLAVSLGVTYGLWHSAQQGDAQNLQTEFDFRVRETIDHIEQRMASYEQVLRGVQGLFAVSAHVDSEALHRYVATLRLDEHYSGIQGVGYALKMPESQVEGHVAAMRKQGFPHYSIYPAGLRETYAPVIQLESSGGNRQDVIGYDMYYDPVRRAALEQARDNNKVAISGMVALEQRAKGSAQAGFLMVLPVYAKSGRHDALTDRRSSIVGWVYAPFRINDLMAGVIGESAPDLDFEIYDGVTAASAALMYDDDGIPVGGKPNISRIRSTRLIMVAGHPWTLVVSSLPAFEARANKDRLRVIAVSGITLSLLLSLLTWLLATGRARAQDLATAMTRELRESEEHFRSYFERSMVGMATISKERKWIKVNDALCRMLGYSREELVTMTWAGVIHEEDLAADEAQFSRMLDGAIDGYAMDRRFMHKDGHPVCTHLAVRSVSKDGGGIDYILAQMVDITEEQAARARDHLLISALEAVGNCVIITDPDSRVEWVNPAFERLTGYRREEALGHRSGGLMKSGLYDQSFYESMWGTIKSGEVWRGEIMNRRKDGSLYYDELVIAPVKDAGGKISNFVAVNQDITERKHIEEEIRMLNNVLEQRVTERTEELTKANKLLAQEIEERKQTESLATSFSIRLRDMTRRLIEVQEMERRRLAGELHDRIGSNLTAIGLNLQLMESVVSLKLGGEMADRVADCAALVEDTMASARDISADLHPATLDYVGLLPALEEYGEKFELRTGIVVEVAGTGSNVRLPPQIEIALFRIAQEALTNCAKHAKTASVRMELSIDAEQVVFSIMDAGEGFDVINLGAGGDKPGLGLLSMRERAEAIGGQLRIESMAGRGTRIVAETILMKGMS